MWLEQRRWELQFFDLDFSRLYRYMPLLSIPTVPSTPLFSRIPRTYIYRSFSLQQIIISHTQRTIFFQ